ncbi:hypothetical protein Hypma_014445 [Hypsizygus marmoreus]|uniref:Uncharacterized protein n=1 Tax=Hypsizygus marmoreus TaxID=39966 RepID=A0A369JAU7_HYPMA|nr:hypothetical protein Hypma_014445 [Hypsizygus marmoreus]
MSFDDPRTLSNTAGMFSEIHGYTDRLSRVYFRCTTMVGGCRLRVCAKSWRRLTMMWRVVLAVRTLGSRCLGSVQWAARRGISKPDFSTIHSREPGLDGLSWTFARSLQYPPFTYHVQLKHLGVEDI